jgi:hypothetical protein
MNRVRICTGIAAMACTSTSVPDTTSGNQPSEPQLSCDELSSASKPSPTSAPEAPVAPSTAASLARSMTRVPASEDATGSGEEAGHTRPSTDAEDGTVGLDVEATGSDPAVNAFASTPAASSSFRRLNSLIRIRWATCRRFDSCERQSTDEGSKSGCKECCDGQRSFNKVLANLQRPPLSSSLDGLPLQCRNTTVEHKHRSNAMKHKLGGTRNRERTFTTVTATTTASSLSSPYFAHSAQHANNVCIRDKSTLIVSHRLHELCKPDADVYCKSLVSQRIDGDTAPLSRQQLP